MSNDSVPGCDRAALSFVPHVPEFSEGGIRVTKALFESNLWPWVVHYRLDVGAAYVPVHQVPRLWRKSLSGWSEAAEGTALRCRPMVELDTRELEDLRDLAWYAIGVDLLFEVNETSALLGRLAATLAGVYPARRRAIEQALSPDGYTLVRRLKLPRERTALFAFEVDDSGLHIIGRASWLAAFEGATLA